MRRRSSVVTGVGLKECARQMAYSFRLPLMSPCLIDADLQAGQGAGCRHTVLMGASTLLGGRQQDRPWHEAYRQAGMSASRCHQLGPCRQCADSVKHPAASKQCGRHRHLERKAPPMDLGLCGA
jgi:hypothetical protein